VLAEQRQELILTMVNQHGSLSITELQRQLNVSRETIRRDLLALAERNALRKTHGGALSLVHGEPELAVREATNLAGKQAIGRLAATLVPDGATVMICSGSTVHCVADALLIRQGLTVFTNSIAICGKLTGRNKNRVHILGGEIQATNYAALGRDATAMLAHYSADFTFIGAGAIAPDGWVMEVTREEGELHALMLQSARTTVVVADHSKFNRYAPARVAKLESVGYLVTDRQLDQPIAAFLAKFPVRVLVGEERGN
jgi:DeoR family transcriptional regulator, glycerol-3-phosphate regulon repressor